MARMRMHETAPAALYDLVQVLEHLVQEHVAELSRVTGTKGRSSGAARRADGSSKHAVSAESPWGAGGGGEIGSPGWPPTARRTRQTAHATMH